MPFSGTRRRRAVARPRRRSSPCCGRGVGRTRSTSSTGSTVSPRASSIIAGHRAVPLRRPAVQSGLPRRLEHRAARRGHRGRGLRRLPAVQLQPGADLHGRRGRAVPRPALAVTTITIGGRTDYPFTGQHVLLLRPARDPGGDPRRADPRHRVLVPAARVMRGHSFSEADEDHLHHRLMRLGHGPRRTVVILWLWTALLSGVALVPTYTEGNANALVPFGVAGARAAPLHLLPPRPQGGPGDRGGGGGRAPRPPRPRRPRGVRSIDLGEPPAPDRELSRADRTRICRLSGASACVPRAVADLDCEYIHKRSSATARGCGRNRGAGATPAREGCEFGTFQRQGSGRRAEPGVRVRRRPGGHGRLGWLIDLAAGTGPVFLIVFGVFGVVGSFVSFYYWYQAQTARLEEGKPWTRRTH